MIWRISLQPKRKAFLLANYYTALKPAGKRKHTPHFELQELALRELSSFSVHVHPERTFCHIKIVQNTSK